MNEQELNRKLAEWVGLKPAQFIIFESGEAQYNYITKSIDAFIKWIKPEIDRRGFNIHFHLVQGKRPKVVISNAQSTYSATDDSLAVALCLATEKLMEVRHE